MENQHRKITGYRELDQTDIDLMNEIKAQGVVLEALVKKVAAHAQGRIDEAVKEAREMTDADAIEEKLQGIANQVRQADPGRWMAVAVTDLQTGLMALTRAVTQPTSF